MTRKIVEPRRSGRLLSTAEAAEVLGVSARALRDWRDRERGPPSRRIGARLIRYHERELLAWARSGCVAPANVRLVARM
jgi:predicted DNA-binding transcriptional regulator AlpA